MKLNHIMLGIVALLLLILPAKVILLGEVWTWLAALSGIAGIICAAIATSAWRPRGGAD